MNEHATQITSTPTKRSLFSQVLRALIYAMVFVYRHTLRYVIGGQCRFQPTCSQYMLDAVDKYGPVRGFFKGLRRITRCHPWSEGGHDPA